MRTSAGIRLPYFTEEESKELKGSVDFVGLNYYTSNYARKTQEEANPDLRWYSTDRQTAFEHVGQDGELIGEAMGPPGIGWICDCPWGLLKLLGWMETRYSKKEFQAHPVIITENGCMDSELNSSLKKALNDERRVNYVHGILKHLLDAINNEGYFVWSLLDNFEWSTGLICRFGLHYVDYERDQRLHPKLSATWYRQFLTKEQGSSSYTTCEGGVGEGALTRK
ncbi:hypothetical protein GOP47_0021561 [Adiantum capillus-veneris]|uniref:Beta-glucosidase n=1 Tax=Adiantum capillus-veneris TaxID=13818 RepID=A0A9D4U9I1_ADICA|nr:hypothetical protein GOP47_0021561 [Adiantum capillus-veneris]